MSADHAGPCATRAEKLAAFDALTREDWARLEKLAKIATAKFRVRVRHANWKDVLHEAVARALDSREWYPQERSFFSFLDGVISSVSDQWYKQASIDDPDAGGSEDGILKLADDKPSKVAKFAELPEDLTSSYAPPDQEAEANIVTGQMRASLKSRPHAIDIFDLRLDGWSVEEIEDKLGISKKVTAAALKWIIRTLDKGGFRDE